MIGKLGSEEFPTADREDPTYFALEAGPEREEAEAGPETFGEVDKDGEGVHNGVQVRTPHNIVGKIC